MISTYVIKILYEATKKEYVDSTYSTYADAINSSVLKNKERGDHYNKIFYYPDIIQK